MNFKQKMNRLDAIFAYDTGCITSGIKDDSFKAYLKKNREELYLLLTAVAKDYLNSDKGYTIEDIASLLEWAEQEFDLYF